MKRTWVLSAIVICGLSIAGVAAQRDGAGPSGAGQGGAAQGGGRGGGRGGGGSAIPPTGAIQHIKDNLYKIQGAGSNTTVFIREDGVVLVDTKLANNGDAILKQVRTVTDKPVTVIINTHSHPDHNGSNDQIKGATPSPIQVVAHENLKTAVTAGPRPNPATIPDLTFTNVARLGSGKDRIDLYYFGAGHTNNDAFIVFPSVRAMCIGDLMAWNMAPLIDPAAGGSVVALGETLAKAEKSIKGVDLVIEGHGNVNTWQGMRAYGEFMRALVRTAKQGLEKKQTTEQALVELKKNPKFAVFLGTERLKDLEYGDTPEHRALINLNVAYQELRGDAVTTYFGPPQPIGPEKGSAPPPAPRGGGAGGGRGAAPANPAGGQPTPSAPTAPPGN
jgi:cyclase